MKVKVDVDVLYFALVLLTRVCKPGQSLLPLSRSKISERSPLADVWLQ